MLAHELAIARRDLELLLTLLNKARGESAAGGIKKAKERFEALRR